MFYKQLYLFRELHIVFLGKKETMVAIFGSTQTSQTSLSNFVILSFLETHAVVEEMNSKMYWSI